MDTTNITSLGMLLDAPVRLSAELAVSQELAENVLRFEVGTIVKLDKLANAPMTVSINGRRFGHGEVVLVGENLAVRITALIQ